MGKLKFVVVLLLASILNNSYAYDYIQYNTDVETIEQVTSNSLIQKLYNDQQNQQVNSINERQTKLAELLGVISANKVLLREAYKNVVGFKKESRIYISIYNVGGNIIKHSEDAITAINKSKLTGKSIAILRIGSLVADAVTLGKFFADIVSNGTVKNPIEDPNTPSQSNSDGANLLNRHERLKMAYSILGKLCEIDRKLVNITYVCRFASADRLLREVDRESYINMLTAKRHMNGVIASWNALKK